MVAEEQKKNGKAGLHVALNRWLGIGAAFCLFVVGACLGAYSYRVSYEAHGNPLGSMLPEFTPAVLFAAGRGMVVPEDLDCPALEAFLHSETTSFDIKTLPKEITGSHIFFSSQSSFAQSHWLLFYSLGWCWRIFGISHDGLQYVAALFYGFASVALYCLFRVGMGRMVSIVGTLAVIVLPPFLCMAPMLRDFSKAPFILMILALMGYVLKKRCTGKQLLQYGVLLGLVTGIGYGFRQDILICLLPILFILIVAPLLGNWRIVYRIGAVILVVSVFCLAAVPTLIGVRSDSGSVSTHTLFQGLSREAEQRMGFGDAPYDLLLHPYDTEVHAVVNAHARLRGCKEPMDFYLSSAYGRAGRALFLEWTHKFPADLVVRGLASIETCMRLSSLSMEYYAYEPLAATITGQEMDPYYNFYHQYVERYGLIILLMVLLAIAVKNGRQAVVMLLVLGWFMAYPNLLFEVRHAFYLSFIIPWAAFFLLEKGICGIGRSLWKAPKLFSKNKICFSVNSKKLVKVFVELSVVVACVATVIGVLRVYQQKQVAELFDSYWNADLEPVATTQETREWRTLVKPAQPLPGLSESWNLPLGDVATEYLVLEFAPAAYPIPFTIQYQQKRGPDFTRQIVVPASQDMTGNVRYYFPVYEMANYMPAAFALSKHRFSNTPLANLLVHHWGTNRFLGVELYEEDMPLLKGIYHVTDTSRLPWLLYLCLQQDHQGESLYKRMRMEKEWEAFRVNFGLDEKRDANEVVKNYLELLRRFPGYDHFAQVAATLIPLIADPEERSKAWYQLARSVPERAESYAVELAAVGDELQKSKEYVAAEAIYGMALTLSPKDKWYEVKLADSLLARNEFFAAREHYQTVLMVAPESPYSASQINNVYNKQGALEEAFHFWQSLHEKYPEAAVPAMYLARSLERENKLEKALELYKQVEVSHPDNAEALLRQGIIIALNEGYAKGRGMMNDAWERAPELRPEMVAGLTRIAEYYTKTGAHAFAEAIYREVMELAPDDGWLQVRYGEALMAQENYEKAGEVFLDILERAPESPYSAHKLDEVFKKVNARERRLAAWELLCKEYPAAYIPALHFAMTLVDMGKDDQALSQFQAVHEAYPEKQEAALRLGALVARMKDYEQGRIMMDRAVKNDANLASLRSAFLTTLAEYFLENGDADRAASLYSELLEEKGEDDFLQTRLAETLILQARYEEALAYCRKLISKTPESSYIAGLIDSIYEKKGAAAEWIQEWLSICNLLPEAVLPFMRLGAAMEAAGDLKGAQTVYAQALRHAPANATIQLRYGILTALLEDYEQGRTLMDAAVRKSSELSGEMASGLGRIAAAAQEKGENTRAEALYREAMALAPEDYWHQVRLGELLMETEHKEEALDLFSRVLMAQPESPHTASLVDRIYSEGNIKKKRLEMWREIVEANPDALTTQYHLGLAYEACNMPKDAIDIYNRILSLSPECTQAQEAIQRVQDKVQ